MKANNQSVRYNEFDNEVELIAYVRKYENIYIYGAGHVGQILQKRLMRHGVKPRGFLVSNKDGEEKNNLYEMKQIHENTESIIIVAVSEKFREDIIENLRSKGFIQCIVITTKLIQTMERRVNRRLHFQIHLVEHCNLKCRGCYHFSSLAEEEYLDIKEYERDLQRLSELFNGKVGEILLLGGEPLLHPEIDSFIKISRQCFPIGEIKILTNGLLLLDMKDTFYETLRHNDVQLWVTKYPVRFDYDRAQLKAAEHGIRIQYFSGGEEVRSLGHEPLDLSGKQDYKKNYYHCYRANECVDLKHGRLYPCIIPAEIEPFKKFFNLEIPVAEEDYVDIYEVNGADELLEALEKPIPFCRFCNREDIQVFGRIPWSVTKYEIEEWTE